MSLAIAWVAMRLWLPSSSVSFLQSSARPRGRIVPCRERPERIRVQRDAPADDARRYRRASGRVRRWEELASQNVLAPCSGVLQDCLL